MYADRFEILEVKDSQGEIEDKLFGSPAGIVYLAHDHWAPDDAPEKRVGLKVLSNKYARRQRAAADFVVFKKLREEPIDGVVEFVASKRWKNEHGRYQAYVATRYCEFGDAAQNREVFEGKLLQTLIKVLRVLIDVHGRGFLIRDGKPENWLMPLEEIDSMAHGDFGGAKDLRRNAGGTVEDDIAWTAPYTHLTQGAGPHTPPYVDPRRLSGDVRYENGTRETDLREAWHTVLFLVYGFMCRDPETGRYLLEDPLPDWVADETPTGRVVQALNDVIMQENPTPGALLELAVKCDAWVERCGPDGVEVEPPPWLATETVRNGRKRLARKVIAAAVTLGLVLTAVHWLGLGVLFGLLEPAPDDPPPTIVVVEPRPEPDPDDEDPIRPLPDEEEDDDGRKEAFVSQGTGTGQEPKNDLELEPNMHGTFNEPPKSKADLGAEKAARDAGLEEG